MLAIIVDNFRANKIIIALMYVLYILYIYIYWWALRCLGVDEWIVSVIKAMYEDATTTVRVNGRESKVFSVRVGVHQGLCPQSIAVYHCIRGLV